MARTAAAPKSREESEQGIDRLIALASTDLNRVNTLILSKTGSSVTMIPEVAQHLISSGGKRLRPLLTIAAAHAAGYSGDHHIALAAAVEFMHTATLLHDDVVDESELRRGRKTARMVWGNQASVLVGDFLLGQAFKMMVDTGSLDCLAILSHAATVIAEGEVMQLAASKSLETTEERYMAVIKAKTAALFAAACEVGPALDGRSADDRAALASYGMNLGIAFQLVDDALDYAGDEASLGKRVGDDFREGKITLPVILAFRAGDEEERAFWRRTIENGQIADGDLVRAIALLRRHGALDETMARALSCGDMARSNLASLAPSVARDALDDVIGFAIARAR